MPIQESYLTEYGQEDPEEEERRRQAALAPAPAPSPGYGGAIGGTVASTIPGYAPPPEPVYGPPVPTYQENVQAMVQQNPQAAQIAASEAAASDLYGTTIPQIADYQVGGARGPQYGPAFNGMTQAGLEDIQAPPASLRAQVIGQAPIDSGYVATVPQGYTESPLVTGLRVAQGPLQVAGGTFEALNFDIPVVTPAIQAASPYVSDIVNAAGSSQQLDLVNRGLGAVGLPELPNPGIYSAANYLLGQVGAPSVGEIAVESELGKGGALDIALLAAPGVGDYDFLYRGGRAALGRQIDNLIPSPAALAPDAVPSPAMAENVLRANRAEMGIAGAAMSNEEASAFRAAFDQAWGPNALPQTQAGLIEQVGNRIDATERARDFLRALGQNPEGTPSVILNRYERAMAQLYPENAAPDVLERVRFAQQADVRNRQAAEGLAGGGTPPTSPVVPNGNQIDSVVDSAVDDLARGDAVSGGQVSPTLGSGANPSIDIRPMGEGMYHVKVLDWETFGTADEVKAALKAQFGTDGDVLKYAYEHPDAVAASGKPNLARTAADDALDRRLAGGGTPEVPPRPPEGVAGPATPPPSSLLPERTATPDFQLVGEPYPTPAPLTNSQRIDELMAANRPQTPSFPMTSDEALAEAQRIGFPIDEGALRTGTPLARQQEMDRLSAAIDLDNFHRTASSENQALETWIRMTREGNPTPPPGGYPSGVSTPQSRSVFDRLMEAAYVPFSGDVGTALRQDITRTANPFRLAESRQVAGYVARAADGATGARAVATELDGQVSEWAQQYGHRLNLADWQGANLTNRETMQSSLTNSVPILRNLNAMNATELNARRVVAVENFLKAHPNAKPAEVGTYMNYVERVTGRGAVPAEDVLGRLGPLFTSMRYALSIPERVPYLLPVTRLTDGSWQLFGPVWREAVVDHAGFAAALGGTLYLAQEAGLNVDWEKGSIRVGQTTYNLTGGISGYWNTIQRMADGDLMAGAEFVRNKIGPLPQALVQGIQATGLDRATGTQGFFEFMRPEWWNRGATGSGSDVDRVAAFGMMLWLQDVAKAVRFNPERGLAAGLITAPAALFGISTSSFPGNPRTAANNAVMANPDNFKGIPPNVAEFLQGKSWNAATPQEQRAILANATPEERAAIEAGEEVLRNRKDIFQLNRDEQRERYELAAENRAKLQPLADQTLADWKSGAVDPMKAIDTIKRIEAAADREAGFTRNIGPKLSESAAYQEAVKGISGEKTAEQKEVDRIREIEQKYYAIRDDPRVKRPDGTIDWDRVELAQKAVMDSLRRQDPGFATRVEFNLQKDPANDFELTRYIAKIDERLEASGYYDQPTGTKTQFAREHPEVDALLSWRNGWPVHSQQAAEILLRLAPERKVAYAK